MEDSDHLFAVPALPSHRSHPDQRDLREQRPRSRVSPHIFQSPSAATSRSEQQNGFQAEPSSYSGHGARSTGENEEPMQYQGNPVPEVSSSASVSEVLQLTTSIAHSFLSTQMASRVYNEFFQTPRDAPLQRSGSVVPWSTPTYGNPRYAQDYHQMTPFSRASSVYSAVPGLLFHSPTGRNPISRGDRNWLLNTVASIQRLPEDPVIVEKQRGRSREADSVDPLDVAGSSKSIEREELEATNHQQDSFEEDGFDLFAGEQGPEISIDDDLMEEPQEGRQDEDVFGPQELYSHHPTREEPPSSHSNEQPPELRRLDQSRDVHLPQVSHEQQLPSSRPLQTVIKESASQQAPRGPPIVLDSWFLGLVPCKQPPSRIVRSHPEAASLTHWVWVEGLKRGDQGQSIQWHSSVIASRVGPDLLQTSSGSLYQVNGPMDRHRAQEQGLSKATAEAFASGFPDEWARVVIKDLSKIEARKAVHFASQAVVVPAYAAEEDRAKHADEWTTADAYDLSIDSDAPNELEIIGNSSDDHGRSQRSAKAGKRRGRASKTKTSAPSKKKAKRAVERDEDDERDAEAVEGEILSQSSTSHHNGRRVSAKPTKQTPKPSAQQEKRKVSKSSSTSAKKKPRTSISREVLMLAKSPFGVMRAVQDAIALRDESDEDELVLSSPPREMRHSPTTDDEDSVGQSGSRSVRRRKSMDDQWWVVSPGVVKRERKDDDEDSLSRSRALAQLKQSRAKPTEIRRPNKAPSQRLFFAEDSSGMDLDTSARESSEAEEEASSSQPSSALKRRTSGSSKGKSPRKVVIKESASTQTSPSQLRGMQPLTSSSGVSSDAHESLVSPARRKSGPQSNTILTDEDLEPGSSSVGRKNRQALPDWDDEEEWDKE